MPINLEIDTLHITDILSADLGESLNHHPALKCSITVSDTRDHALRAVGKTVKYALSRANRGRVNFNGYVTDIWWDDRESVVRFLAIGDSIKLDLVRQTRTFAARQQDPQPISELPGFGEAFPGVGGINLLDSLVSSLTQADETKWQLLVRAAALSGACILAANGRINVAREPAGKVRKIEPHELIKKTAVVRASIGVADQESLTWDTRNGVIPQQAVAASAAADGGVHSHPVSAGRNLVGPGVRSQGPGNFPPRASDRDRAQLLADMEAARLFEWSGEVRAPEIACGDRVELPKNESVGTPLIVRARSLQYEANLEGEQLRNLITAVAASQFVADGDAAIGRHAPSVVTGQVAAVSSADELPCALVNFPWQARPADDPESWEGIWCDTPQPFGGRKDRPHGVSNLPQVLDWVRVLFDPFDVAAPVILGSVVHGGNRIPSQLYDHTKDRVLLITETGHVIVAREDGKALVIAISEDGTEANAVCRIVLKQAEQGPEIIVQASDGTVTMEGTELVFKASNKVTFKTPEMAVEEYE